MPSCLSVELYVETQDCCVAVDVVVAAGITVCTADSTGFVVRLSVPVELESTPPPPVGQEVVLGKQPAVSAPVAGGAGLCCPVRVRGRAVGAGWAGGSGAALLQPRGSLQSVVELEAVVVVLVEVLRELLVSDKPVWQQVHVRVEGRVEGWGLLGVPWTRLIRIRGVDKWGQLPHVGAWTQQER